MESVSMSMNVKMNLIIVGPAQTVKTHMDPFYVPVQESYRKYILKQIRVTIKTLFQRLEIEKALLRLLNFGFS